jgi:hypothetical protein
MVAFCLGEANIEAGGNKTLPQQARRLEEVKETTTYQASLSHSGTRTVYL